MSEPRPPVLPPEPWPGGRPVDEGFPELAGYGRRFAARLIDGILVGVIPFVLLLWLTAQPGRSRPLFVYYAVTFGIAFLNDVVITSATGGTIGKLTLGTRVARVQDWSPITPGIAMGRWAAIAVLNFIPLAGLADALWIYAGEMRQTLHDKVAGTTVVRVRGGVL